MVVMKSKTMKRFLVNLFAAILLAGCGEHSSHEGDVPLIIAEQSSFAVGGTVATDGKQTLHGDHASAFYQIPVDPRPYSLVMLHGAGQFSKTWETTPDGREGFQTIFLRRGFPLCLIDQPQRGDAGRSTVYGEIVPTYDDQDWFGRFRVGVWPDYFPGVQFPGNEQSLDQYFRQMTPNTGPFDMEIISDAVAALFDRIVREFL